MDAIVSLVLATAGMMFLTVPRVRF